MTSEDLLVSERTIIDNILTRTSIREYDTGRAIPREIKKEILHAAMSAPSAVNRRPWSFIVVDDALVLRRLSAALPYAKMASKAPLAIAVCGDTSRFLEGDDSTLWVQDLSAASENILLAAHGYGLGAVWTSVYPHADREASVREILSLPMHVIPFNVIPIGYPTRPHTPHDKWEPDRIHHNSW